MLAHTWIQVIFALACMGIGKYLTAFDHVVKACKIFEQTGIKEYSIAFFLHCALDICLTLLKAVKAGEGKFQRTH